MNFKIPEATRKGNVLFRRYGLIPKEEHFEVQERPPKLGHLSVSKGLRQIETRNDAANGRANLGNREAFVAAPLESDPLLSQVGNRADPRVERWDLDSCRCNE